MGKHSEALKEIKIAQQLDPSSDIISSAAGMIYFYDRRYVEGLTECERVLQRNPAFTPAHRISRGIYQMMGDYEAALRAYKKERNFLGDADENERGWMMTRGMVEAISGRREAALKLIEQSLTLDLVRNNPQSFGYEIALAYAYAYDKENALLWLEKSEAARERKLIYAPVEPIFLDKLANEPRFAALVKKLQTPLR
jgi:tetratricopeptide (TPR) repeat protein